MEINPPAGVLCWALAPAPTAQSLQLQAIPGSPEAPHTPSSSPPSPSVLPSDPEHSETLDCKAYKSNVLQYLGRLSEKTPVETWCDCNLVHSFADALILLTKRHKPILAEPNYVMQTWLSLFPLECKNEVQSWTSFAVMPSVTPCISRTDLAKLWINVKISLLVHKMVTSDLW